MSGFTESIVEDPALGWLEALGYAVEHDATVSEGQLTRWPDKVLFMYGPLPPVLGLSHSMESRGGCPTMNVRPAATNTSEFRAFRGKAAGGGR